MGVLMTWIKAHKAAAAALGLLLLWIIYRAARGLALTSAGHASPEDAISYGWSVYPAGISGWKEVSPDGKVEYWHETGWTGDPYSKGPNDTGA